jgi:hypothetical protein
MQIAELTASLGLVPDEASWKRGDELVKKLHHAIEGYLGYEGLMKVKELISSTVEAAQEAKNMGEQLGISAESVQELGYAAIASDVSVGQLQGAMQRLSRGLEDAKTKGTGPMASALSKLGVHMKDLKGQSLDQNLELLADAFANAGPQVNKTALAIEMFGRSAGPRMLLLLNKGKDGIQGLRNEAEELGYVMGGEALENAEKFEGAQKRLTATLIGVRNEAVSALLPAFEEMTQGLGDWVKENRAALVSGLKTFLEGVAIAFRAIGAVLKVVIDIFKDHFDIVLSVIGAYLILKAASIGAALAAAEAWLTAMAPLVLGTLAVVALGLVFRKLVDIFKNGGGIMKAAMVGVGIAIAVLTGPIGVVMMAIAGLVAAALSIKTTWSEALDYVADKANAAWETMKDIPVVGQVLKAGVWLGHKIGGGDGEDGIDSVRTMPSVESGGGSSGGDSEVAAPNIDVGGIHLNIDASNMTPEELKAHLSDQIEEKLGGAVRNAYTNLKGGKR